MRPGELLEQRYRLVRVLGRGRSGSVWCARNELIDRAVAVKVLHRSLASDPERLQRFFQEARACGRVRHPSVVEVLDLGQGDDGILFLVMELLEGETMASLLGRKGRVSVDEALALIIPLAHGLAAAHAHGILHRDLKPANIYLHKTPTGGLQPKILDFGISKIIGNDVTATGVVLGTPSYMSPEQARGVPDLDARTDVWSLGVILYECLTGRLPFIAKEYRGLVDEIIEKPHTPVSQLVPEIPIEVSQIVDEALEKSRDRRLSSASAMAQKLTGVLRLRGRMDVLRDPEEEFSDGAPTLAKDRDLKRDVKTGEVKSAPASEPRAPAPEKRPAPQPSASITTQGTGPVVPGAKVAPSALTAAIAAQTAGAKRVSIAAPRPAAGSPARPSTSRMKALSEPSPTAKITHTPEETAPDALPAATLGGLGGVGGQKPEPASARASTTQSWEVTAAQAASGRAEVLLGSAAPVIEVSADWDTTVADVAASELEKGPLPKLAPAPPPAFSEPPPARGSVDTTQKTAKSFAGSPIVQHESVPPADAPRKNLSSIPGFTTAAKPALKQTTPATLSTGTAPPRASTPPPRPVASTAPPRIGALDADHDAVVKKSPPRPPPKSMPPPGNAFSGNTMRPPKDGFAAPPTVGVAPSPIQPTDFMIAPELYALGEEKISEPNVGHDGNGNGNQPVVLSAEPDANLETDKHRRIGPSLVPMMVAAVAVLFFFGAVIGTVAASRRGNAHHARKFASASGLLVAWHDQYVRTETAEAKAFAATKEKEAAAAAPEPDPAAPSSAKGAAAPTAAPKPVATAKPVAPVAPVATAKPPTKTTTPTKTTATAKPTSTAKSTSEPPKKKPSGEWWQKKF